MLNDSEMNKILEFSKVDFAKPTLPNSEPVEDINLFLEMAFKNMLENNESI